MTASAEFDLEPHLDAVTDLVRSASDGALAWYRKLDVIENKLADQPGRAFDPVTEADRAVESRLREGLTSLFPDHAVHGEEFGVTEPPGAEANAPARHRWTIDPIDGTRAFITGQPMWGTLVGLQDGDRPTAGWMHVPTLGETFVGHNHAELHIGAERRSIRVSEVTELPEAVVMSTDPTMFAPGPETDRFDRLRAAVKLVRFGGDCLNYGLLAMGLSDLVVENGLAPYDIVPLIPIIRAAGGIVTGLDGSVPMGGGYVVAAATPELHAAAIEVLT